MWEDATAEKERDDGSEGTDTEKIVQQDLVENMELASASEEKIREAEEPEIKQ